MGALAGISSVQSGLLDGSKQVQKGARIFLRKVGWYLFGLQVTASYEIPLFQVVLSKTNSNDIGTTLALVFLSGGLILYFVLIHRYIEGRSEST